MMNEKIRIAVRALDSKKAMDLRLLRVDSLTSLADYFLFCSGTSVTQVKALADECEYQMKEAGYPVSHREGRESGNWILLDFGDLYVLQSFHYHQRIHLYKIRKLHKSFTKWKVIYSNNSKILQWY